MQDVLSEILRLVRLKACVYFQRDFHAPWGMDMPDGPVAQFHLIVRGSAYLDYAGDCVQLDAGDVVLFPRGAAHALVDQPDQSRLDGREVMASFATDTPAFASGDMATRLMCGHYEYRGNPAHLLIDQLPAMIHVRAFDALSGHMAGSVIPLLIHEMEAGHPGASAIVEHLAEILLVQVMREYFRQHPHATSLYAGLSDARLVEALKLVHTAPSTDLSLEDMARVAGMSRSVFSLRFKEVVGHSPMEYLTQWRMMVASNLLISHNMAISAVAEQVGYQSEISFARAFKRETGATPSAYRRHQAILEGQGAGA